jgi:hypothetical protein
MISSLRARFVIAALAASFGALTVAGIASAQSESQHKPGASGMQGGMGGMMGMMQGCPMMSGGGGHGMPHLPPGNEKLELQMHADMMRAMSDILTKYAARLPDKK